MSHGDTPNYGTEPIVATEPYADDVRVRLTIDAEEVVGRYPQKRSALLPLLHLVQSVDGYVSTRGIEFCAEVTDLTPAEVSGVATFYTQFKRYPNGSYTVGVCTNTLCAIMGGDAIWDSVSAHLGIGHDETTPDGRITLERVECNAGCDYAPVVMANWEFFDNQTPTSAIAMVDALRAGKDVQPTRGAATVATFKEVSRLLAGFPDGRALEGDTAGPATLVGLRYAKDKGWEAPAPRRPSSATTGASRHASPASGAPSGGPPAAPKAPAVSADQAVRATGSQETPSNAPDDKPGTGDLPPAGAGKAKS